MWVCNVMSGVFMKLYQEDGCADGCLYFSDDQMYTQFVSDFDASSLRFIGDERITVIYPGWLIICFTFMFGCFFAAS